MGASKARFDQDLATERRALIEYLKVKTQAEDWHGVSDAANDLRELEARARGRREEDPDER